MATVTDHPNPPQVIVIGSGRSQLEPVIDALSSAGYAATALAPDDDLEADASAQSALVAVIERGQGGNTAVLSIFRRLAQRPALAIIDPTGVSIAAGFGPLCPSSCAPEDLPKLLGDYLGLEPIVAPPRPPSPAAEPPSVPETLRGDLLPEDLAAPELVQLPGRSQGDVEPPRQPAAATGVQAADPLVDVREAQLPADVQGSALASAQAADLPPAPLPAITTDGAESPQYEQPAPASRSRTRSIWVSLLILVAIVVGGLLILPRLSSKPTPSLTITATQLPASANAADVAHPATPAPPTLGAAPAATPAPPMPDLDVQIIDVSPAQPRAGDVVVVKVRVRNIGGRPITGSFWVDLYVSPDRTPTAQTPWSEISAYGATWQVRGLSPGEARDLNSLDADPSRSNLLRLDTPGLYQLYVLADTFSELSAEFGPDLPLHSYLGGPAEVLVRNAPQQP